MKTKTISLLRGIQCFIMLACLLSCTSSDAVAGPKEEAKFINVEQAAYTVAAEGGSLTIPVQTNAEVKAISQEGWCEAEVAQNGSNAEVTLTVKENKGEERVSGILLTAEGCDNIELTVTQKAYDEGQASDEEKTWLEFRVATYNIRYKAAEDEQSGNGWDVRKEPLAKLITSHDFDIVGTQEGNDQQLADLQQMLPEYAYVGHPYGGSSGNSHNCATFYKTALFEVVDEGVFWYSETPDVPSIGWDATDRRICYWVRFREKKSGKEFYFFNSHFYWRYKTAKENSGTVMVNKIKEIAGDVPTISVGDLNSTESTPQMLKILTLLQDSYYATESAPAGPVNTGLPGGVFEGNPGSRIDYVLLSSGIRVRDYAVLNDTYNNGHYPSDHLPVTCRIAIELQND